MSSPVEMNRSEPDDLLDRALRESLGGRFASAAGAAVSSAWAWSASRRAWSAAVARWRALLPSARVRAIALAGAVAVLVNRAMSRLGPAEPLGDVVPLLVVVACALTAVLAVPIARALERLER